MRLNKNVSPLIGKQINNNADNRSSINEKFWDRGYKASDFAIKDGQITLPGGYYLKSVRIKKTKDCWLKDIDHVFHIAPYFNDAGVIEPKRFHFVPDNDLSLLLNKIQVKEIFEECEVILFKYLNITDYNACFDVSKPTIYSSTCFKGQHFYMFGLSDYSNPKITCFRANYSSTYQQCPYNICIPMSDVTIDDGMITILTKNVKFILQLSNNYIRLCNYCGEAVDTHSWENFSSELYGRYDAKIIDEILDDLKAKYIKDIEVILQPIRNLKSITLDTYQSRKGFLECFQNKYLYFVLYKNFKEWYLFDKRFHKDVFVSDSYEYDEITLNKIADIIDNNWDIVKDEEWLFSDIIPIKHKPKKIRNISKKLRIVTEYYESRIEIPKGYNCTDYVVSFFEENAAHFSDFDYDKSIESFRTFMVWPKNGFGISLIPTNRRYSKCTFHINNSSKEIASYVIWCYFSSNIINKRQCLYSYKKIFELFGIYEIER